MKKYQNASFALEFIVSDDGVVTYVVRDRAGAVCVLGSLDDVVFFCNNLCEEVEKSKNVASDEPGE